VVVDEASQMRPEQALGAIGRGRQLVVVGDPQQLPPTSFFERIDLPDEDETQAEDYVDTESILDLALAVFHPARELRWHYRSRHERLIAFSNEHFYGGALVVFPSPLAQHRDYGVEYRHVDGIYTPRAGINMLETQVVAEAAVQFMATYPSRSLGLVTINQAQREILTDEMDRLFARDPHAEDYRKRWQGTLEPFFVKNLENVQGDERDIIFISTVYGLEQSGGRVAQRFGPINAAAGHRRLNVLFTRAKEKVVIFSSMQPADVIPTATSRPGVVIFKHYLEYALSGRLDSGMATGREPDSDFEVFVADRLRREGFEVVPQVGVAGYFIDLAVKDPGDPHRYLLGIECDGASYHSAKSARDRDRLRQEILEQKGWRLYRIWSTDWFNDPEREAKKLLRHLHALTGSQWPG
jgi:very-short-patch-repair endonuclease